jgi:FMN-dependent NADH-azoreductase
MGVIGSINWKVTIMTVSDSRKSKPKILSIQSSGRREGSLTRQLSADVIKQLGGSVFERDLMTSIPHVDEDWINSNFTPAKDRTSQQSATLAYSDELVAELQDADIVVLGVPIYNFGVPAAFKAWYDMVARVGVTFRYTETGPVGLLNDKKAIIVMASGGTPIGSEIDFASPWLKQALRFIGIEDVTIIAADATGRNIEAKLAAAQNEIKKLAA